MGLLTGKDFEVLAVDVEGIVTRIAAGATSRVEDEPVGTLDLGGLAVFALPVQVAVLFVSVPAVLLVGALEAVGQHCNDAPLNDSFRFDLIGKRGEGATHPKRPERKRRGQ